MANHATRPPAASATTPPDAVPADPLLPDATQLAALGNVAADYEHVTKQVRPAGGLAVPGAYLKWYDVLPTDAVIPGDTRDQARDYLRGEASAGRLQVRDELGFVILHRCGADTYFLIVCTWRNTNEMWETLYVRSGDAAFGPVGAEGGHRPVQCVWELAATSHERVAWSRYLRSERDEQAKRAYLADVFTGSA